MSGGGGGGQPVPGKSKNKATSEASTTPTMPSWLSGDIRGSLENYQEGTDQFGGMVEDWRAAGFSPDQLAGFDSIRNAVGPGGDVQSAIEQLKRTVGGDYLFGGDAFNEAVDASYRAGAPRAISAFAGAGRDNNFLGSAALGQIYSDAFANQYGQERQLQQQATQLLPGMSMLPGQALSDIGKQYQELEQYGINTPLALQQQYLASLGGVLPFAAPFTGSQTEGRNISRGTETPAYFPGNQTAGLLGGIASGASTGGMIGGPWGAAIGAGLGGGMSLLG
jgi:hypothetical protein